MVESLLIFRRLFHLTIHKNLHFESVATLLKFVTNHVMSAMQIKKSLLEIATRINANTTLQEVFEQLALLSDIEKSEEQEKKGLVYTHKEVIKRSKKWLK